MCVVSAVSDYYKWPNGPLTYPVPPHPSTWDAETKEMMRRAIELLEKIDQKLGDRECHDESKKEFMEAIGAKPSA